MLGIQQMGAHAKKSPGSYSGPDRRRAASLADVEPVVLRKKFAKEIDGISLDAVEVGDRVCLERDEAELLLAEGWADPVAPEKRRRAS